MTEADQHELITRLLAFAADPDRPLPYRRLAADCARSLANGGPSTVSPTQVQEALVFWEGRTWGPAKEAAMRRAVPSAFRLPVFPPSPEVRRAQHRAGLRRWTLPSAAVVAAIGAVAVSSWALTH